MSALRTSISFRRATVLGATLVLAAGLTACGKKSHPVEVNATNNGTYAYAGAVTYQLQVSRELNQFDTEDRQYLAGVAPADNTLRPDQIWYAVFLWAKNQSHQPQPTAGSFDIVDTEGSKYYPVTINPQANPYAWEPVTLPEGATEPSFNTTAYYGPTQGRLLLFKLNTSAYSNRPLTLEIHVDGQASPTTISLDL